MHRSFDRQKLSLGAVVSLVLLAVLLVSECGMGDEKLPETVSQPTVVSTSAPILTIDGFRFKDLNGNGILDAYEDWRLPASERADDLLRLMTPDEKAAQMIHLTLATVRDTWFKDLGVGFALVYTYMADGPADAAAAANQIQEWCEASRLGIPAILSMDSVMGASWVRGATVFPDQIGLAATRDVDLVRRLAEMQREEMLAIGVRMSLSPIADLATEPRWGRFQECFGEDAVIVAEMVAAAVQGLQDGSVLGPSSVLACVKHFPGSGPQQNGKDGSPLVFDETSLPLHLSVFEAAIRAGTGSIMPYGYSKVPFLGGDAAERYAHESRVVMTDLLRNQMGFQGIIQTDWGMKHLDAALAGADVLGGAGQREVARLAAGIPAEDLDDRVRRILLAKFMMGLFENPYVDVDAAPEIVGAESHRALAFEAASKSLTLLKSEGVSALDGKRIVVAGTLAEDVDALSSGWKVAGHPCPSILDVLRQRAGADEVVYVGDDVAAIASLDTTDCVAVAVVGEKAGTHEPSWGYATLEFPEQQISIVRALRETGIPVITVVLMGRPYVMTELVELSDAVLVAYRPGVTSGAEAIAAALFGETPITGKLPFQIPRSMEQVLAQREDLPGDIEDPLYDAGAGLIMDRFGGVTN